MRGSLSIQTAVRIVDFSQHEMCPLAFVMFANICPHMQIYLVVYLKVYTRMLVQSIPTYVAYLQLHALKKKGNNFLRAANECKCSKKLLLDLVNSCVAFSAFVYATMPTYAVAYQASSKLAQHCLLKGWQQFSIYFNVMHLQNEFACLFQRDSAIFLHSSAEL